MRTASRTTTSRAMDTADMIVMDSRMAMDMGTMDMGINSSGTMTVTTRNDTRTKMRCGDLTRA